MTTTNTEQNIVIASKDFKIIDQPINIMIPVPEEDTNVDEKIVHAWVREMSKTDTNPVLFFKRKYELAVSLNPEDFVLVLMTTSQKKMLTDFSYDRVCVDSIKGISDSGLDLVALVVADKYEEGVPIAFCITSVINQETLQVFYNCVKRAIPNLKPAVFMGDDAPMYYDAWEEIFDYSCDECFLCAWNVDREWQEHLSLIKQEEKKKELHKNLKTLMYELEENSFNEMLEVFTLQLNGEDSKDFYEYFMTYYYWRSQMWAYCFRSDAKINTNMHIETLHGNLEQLSLKSDKPKTIANLIIALINYANDKKFEDFLKSQKEKDESEINTKFHEVEEAEVSTLDEQSIDWEIVSESGNSYHVRKNHICDEECKLTSCHKPEFYKCTCNNYVDSNSPCKHVYFMLQYTQENSCETSNDPNVPSTTGNQTPITLEALKAQAASIFAKLNSIQYMDEGVAQKIKVHLDAIEHLLDTVLQNTSVEVSKEKRLLPEENEDTNKKFKSHT